MEQDGGKEQDGGMEQAGGMEQDGGKEQDGGILFTLSEQGGRPGAPHMVLKWEVVDWDSDLQLAPGMLGVWGFPPCLHQWGRHREELEGGHKPAAWRWLEKQGEV